VAIGNDFEKFITEGKILDLFKRTETPKSFSNTEKKKSTVEFDTLDLYWLTPLFNEAESLNQI